VRSVPRQTATLLALALLSWSVPALAFQPIGRSVLSDIRVLYDVPLAPQVALFGPPAPAPRFDYAVFAVELTAYLAKEILRDSPDEFYGSSNLSSTWTAKMPATDHDFGEHCLRVVADIGSGISSQMPDTAAKLEHVGVSAPTITSYAAQGIGTLLAAREIWKAMRSDIVDDDDHSDLLSISPKVGSNKVAVALTIHW